MLQCWCRWHTCHSSALRCCCRWGCACLATPWGPLGCSLGLCSGSGLMAALLGALLQLIQALLAAPQPCPALCWGPFVMVPELFSGNGLCGGQAEASLYAGLWMVLH